MIKQTPTQERTPGSLDPDCCAALASSWDGRAREMRAHADADRQWADERAGRYIARAEIFEMCAKELIARVQHNAPDQRGRAADSRLKPQRDPALRCI